MAPPFPFQFEVFPILDLRLSPSIYYNISADYKLRGVSTSRMTFVPPVPLSTLSNVSRILRVASSSLSVPSILTISCTGSWN